MNLGIKPFKLKQKSVIPGFGITMGFTLTYLTLLVLIPVSMVFLNSAQIGLDKFWEIVFRKECWLRSRYPLVHPFGCGNKRCFGLLLAWVLERYDFWGKKLVDGLIDLPFALPTAVAGISLTTLYSQNGWIGRLSRRLESKYHILPWV